RFFPDGRKMRRPTAAISADVNHPIALLEKCIKSLLILGRGHAMFCLPLWPRLLLPNGLIFCCSANLMGAEPNQAIALLKEIVKGFLVVGCQHPMTGLPCWTVFLHPQPGIALRSTTYVSTHGF